MHISTLFFIPEQKLYNATEQIRTTIIIMEPECKLKSVQHHLTIQEIFAIFVVDTAMRATQKCVASQFWPADRGLRTADAGPTCFPQALIASGLPGRAASQSITVTSYRSELE